MSAFIKTIAQYLLGGDSCIDGNDATTQSQCVDDLLWFEILLRCDEPSLLRAEQTCQLFHKILNSSSFWIEKCEYDGVHIPPLSWRKFLHQKELENLNDSGSQSVSYAIDYKNIFFRRPYQRDLAIPVRTSSTLSDLEEQGMVFKHGGNGLIIENPPVYCDSSEVRICFATSYDWCYRYCEIDLVKSGVEDWIMDEIRPKITVRERCACRGDCGATYELNVQLLRNEEFFDTDINSPRFRATSRSWDQWEGGRFWETIEEVFTDYPIGMRKLAIMSRGKDNQFWAGHYGSKFGSTEVLVSFPEKLRLLSPEDFPDEEGTSKNTILLNNPLHSLRVPVGLRGRFPVRRHV